MRRSGELSCGARGKGHREAGGAPHTGAGAAVFEAPRARQVLAAQVGAHHRVADPHNRAWERRTIDGRREGAVGRQLHQREAVHIGPGARRVGLHHVYCEALAAADLLASRHHVGRLLRGVDDLGQRHRHGRHPVARGEDSRASDAQRVRQRREVVRCEHVGGVDHAKAGHDALPVEVDAAVCADARAALPAHAGV